MPLTDLQRRVVEILGPFRTQHNYAAGGAVLNLEWPRQSDDVDIFTDRANQLLASVEPELQALRDNEFSVEITAQYPDMVEAILRHFGFETKVQWFDDPESRRRFFPAFRDDVFGFRLHQADLAVNKVLCASRRRQAPRDAVDLVNIINRYSTLGPLVWAVTGKDPRLAPPQIIRSIHGIAFGYSSEEIGAVRMASGERVTRQELRATLEPALDAAHDYCDDIAPMDYGGYLFVDANGTPIEADDQMITNGEATAIAPKDFGITPVMENR